MPRYWSWPCAGAAAPGLLTGYVLLVFGMAGTALLAIGWQDVLAALGRDPTFTNRTRIWQLALECIGTAPGSATATASFLRADKRRPPT